MGCTSSKPAAVSQPAPSSNRPPANAPGPAPALTATTSVTTTTITTQSDSATKLDEQPAPTRNEPSANASYPVSTSTASVAAATTTITTQSDNETKPAEPPVAAPLEEAAASESVGTTEQGNSFAEQDSPAEELAAATEVAVSEMPMPATVKILPAVGFVIKTRNLNNDEKLFVNVMTFQYLKTGVMISIPKERSVDKKGEECVAFGMILDTESLDSCRGNPSETNEVYAKSPLVSSLL
jgi:hypothetical protein